MFFLGLLSSPIPYLLLTGFYFLSFVVGMSKNDQAETENKAIAGISIQVEIQKKATPENTVFLQTGKDTPKHFESELPDIRELTWHFNHGHFTANLVRKIEPRHCDPEFTNVLFSRPPPHFSI